jgi:hypothetical protein
MRKSRLSKSFQKRSRNTLIISILAILGILFLLFRYGLPLISDASFLFGRVTSTDKQTNLNSDKEKEFVPVPSLDSLPKATKESAINLTGTSLPGLKIEIYLNGVNTKSTIVDKNGDFETNINLTEGENIIKAKAIKNSITSNFSDAIVIIFKEKGPELTIDSPSEGAQLSGQKIIEVKGKTDPESSVIVNDFQAIIDSNGNWNYSLTLKGGENEIKIVSTDSAGNLTEKIIRVNYSE